jgi:hypothetical protein
MMRHQMRSAADIVAYITDCTLATVVDLRMKKSASKSETLRQISIAQTAIDTGRLYDVSFRGTRAQQVIDCYGCDVTAWAEQYKP